MPSRTEQWVEDVCATGDRIKAELPLDRPLPEGLARLHSEFERVHPFIDGNGRAGRLLLNLILVRLGYPPVIILKRQRGAYLAAMQRADASDYGALGELIARAMHDNLNRFILPNVAGPVRIVPLAALVTKEVSLEALRHAARRGRLAGRCPGSRRTMAQFQEGGRCLPRFETPAARVGSLTSTDYVSAR